MVAMAAKIVTTMPVPTLEELRSGPPTVSVPRAGQYLGVSRAYAYAMAREGLLPVIRLGEHRVRVSSIGLLRMLEGAHAGLPATPADADCEHE